MSTKTLAEGASVKVKPAHEPVSKSFLEHSKIWMNGKMVPWSEATVHIATHALHYATAIFEGIRCYATPRGPAVYRLDRHIERLYNSSKIYRMEPPYPVEELSEAILELIRINDLPSCYIRPIVYRGYASLGVNPFPCPVDVAILLMDWGKYLGDDALDNGVDVCVSSWSRMAPNTLPALAKSAANYMNSGLIKMEAILGGFHEGIALNHDGYVSEGSGENIFIVRGRDLITPPLEAAILPGITRDSVMTIARDLGYAVVETNIPREMLYCAEEVFLTGTAAEITPIRSIDRIKIGCGKAGPVAREIQREFFALIDGEREDRRGWLTHVR